MMGRKRRRRTIHTFNFCRWIWYQNKARSSYFCSKLLSIHPALSQTATRAFYIPFKTSSKQTQGYQLWQRPGRHLWRHSVTKNCRQLTRRVLQSVVVPPLKSGLTFAISHAGGNLPVESHSLRRWARLREMLGAAIFKAFTGIPSGPVAFARWRSLRAFDNSVTLRMVNLKGSIFGNASSGANSDSTSLQLAKREDAIDVKYEFIASAMSLCSVSSLSPTINLPISQLTFLFRRACLRVFQKLRGFGLFFSNFSVKYVFLAFLSHELIKFAGVCIQTSLMAIEFPSFFVKLVTLPHSRQYWFI